MVKLGFWSMGLSVFSAGWSAEPMQNRRQQKELCLSIEKGAGNRFFCIRIPGLTMGGENGLH